MTCLCIVPYHASYLLSTLHHNTNKLNHHLIIASYGASSTWVYSCWYQCCVYIVGTLLSPALIKFLVMDND